MNVREEAIERIEQTKMTLKANLESDHLDYMAYIGAIIECNLLIEQFHNEKNNYMTGYHKRMKAIIVKEFERYCLKNGYRFKD